MRPLPLTPEAQAVFSRIRTYDWVLLVFGMSHARVWRLVQTRVRNRIKAAVIAIHERNMYRLFVSELLKAFRTLTGEPLVRSLELAIRRWANFGLKAALLQELLCDCFLRLEQFGYGEPRSRVGPAAKRLRPKSRRFRLGSYEEALRKGRASRSRSGTPEEQAAAHREGSAQAAVIANKLRPVLAEHGVASDRFVSYFAFAQRLGRLSRNYRGESLRMAASDLVDLYEAKSLHGDVLRAISQALLGIRIPL